MVGWKDLRHEPFRVFFPLGVMLGCLGVGHWLVYAIGWSNAYSGFYHASMQIGAYMSCFIVGFLLTALPRFSSTTPASSLELVLALGLMAAQVAGLWMGQWLIAEGCLAGLLVLLATFAARRFTKKRASVTPPTEFVWLPIALALGLVGTGLLMLVQAGGAPAWLMGVARPMIQQGFLLGTVLGVAGFMAPRLMGRDVLLVTPDGTRPETALAIRRRRIRLHGLAAVVLASSFLVEGLGAIRLAYVLRAMVVTAEFAWTTRFYRLPAAPDGYVKLLWVSIWMPLLGLWGAGLVPRYRIAMLHLVFLGGFSLMSFAVGTMVVLSHTGEGQRLRQPLWVLRVVGLGVAGSLIARLVAEARPTWFFPWLGVAATCWIVAGISWLVFIVPRVTRPLAPGAFEQVHEEAKRRLLKTSAPDKSVSC